MADRRAKIIDGLVDPAVLPGLVVVAGRVTVDNTKTVTIPVVAKSIFFAVGSIGAATVARTVTITNNTASIVFTAGADGELNYLIIGSTTETLSDLDAGTASVTLTPIT